jgi:hypothetical protein
VQRLHTISSSCRNPGRSLDGFHEFICVSNIECTAEARHYCLLELSYVQDQMRRCQLVMQQLYSVRAIMRVPTWPRQSEGPMKERLVAAEAYARQLEELLHVDGIASVDIVCESRQLILTLRGLPPRILRTYLSFLIASNRPHQRSRGATTPAVILLDRTPFSLKCRNAFELPASRLSIKSDLFEFTEL